MSICLTQIDVTKLQTIRALVVDEDKVYQSLLCKLLKTHGIEVVGKASSLNEAVLVYQAARPDVVLIDLNCEGETRIAALSKFKELDPPAKVIALSVLNYFEDDTRGRSGVVDAYITKGSAAREIVDTVRRVVIGKVS